jgi:membrane protease YdiL (CAAX protease family)
MRLDEQREILVFIAIAFALSIALSLFIGLTGGPRSAWIGLGYASMLIPAIAAFTTNAVTHDERGPIGFDHFPLRYLPAALLLMPLVMHAAMLPVAAAEGGLHWQDWLTQSADGLYHPPATRGWGALTPLGLGVHIAVNAIAGMMVASGFAFFEEIGWRGWLLPRLLERTGPQRAVAVCSAIWAVWHVPYALSGIQHVEGVSIGWLALIVPAGIFGSGLVIGWLWLRTGSIWITAIAHGALNNWGQYAFKFLADVSPSSELAALSAGSLALIVVGAVLIAQSQTAHSPATFSRPRRQ